LTSVNEPSGAFHIFQTERAMLVRNSPKSYGSVAIAMHWAVVVLVLGAALTGLFGDDLPKG